MLRVAIIGTGVMGVAHARAICDSDIMELVAFVGREPVKTKGIAKRFSVGAYTDIEEMLRIECIDIVDVCTPTFLHEDAVRAAVRYKKHIMCEKPFTLSHQLAQELVALIDSSGVKAMVLQVTRFWPEYVCIRNMIKDNTLGDISHIYMSRHSVHPSWSTWHTDPLKSGGGLYDLHIHDIDFLHQVFGRLKSVYAVGHKSVNGCYNTITTSLRFESEVTAVVDCSMDMIGSYPFTTQVRAMGDNATLEYHSSSGSNSECDTDSESGVVLFEASKAPVKVQIEHYDPYKTQLEYFAKCIMENTPVEFIKMSEVLYVLRILSAIEKSLETNKVVTVI